MNFSLIKKMISNAIDRFYSENKESIKNWKTNKSYVSAFSKTLEQEFDSWDVDCYYVHYDEHKFPDFLDHDRFCQEKDTSVTCEDCLKRKWCNACPDIIIHHRNSRENLLVIQTALSCHNQIKKEQNFSKIKSYINNSDSSYQYGLFINWAPSRNQVSLTWLSHSILKRQESLNHRKEKEDGKYYIESYSAFKTPRVKPDNYIVGLLDILGAQERLKNAMSELTFINSLNYNYYFLDYLKTEGMGNDLIIDNVILRIYSDNIIFAQKSTCSAAPFFDFNIIRLYMACYQLILLSNGFLSRGFITQGNLFINDSFIIGSALAKVHEGEKHIAKYPRVVIDPQLMQLLPDQIHKYPLPPDRFLKKDRIDGHYFLNFYQAMFIERSKIWHRAIFDATKTIIDNLRQPKHEILPKLYWLAKYHNSFCKKYHCDEFIIPQEIITKMQRLVKRSVR